MAKKRIENKHNKQKETIKKNGNITAKFVNLSSQYAASRSDILYTDQYIRYGIDNRFPYYLQELLRNSGMHRSIIERKVNMLIGSGLSFEGGEVVEWMPNPYEKLEDILQKCAYDQETYGGYYLQIIWARGGQEIAEIYHMPYERMRAGLPNEMGLTETYYYWSDVVEDIQSWTDLGRFKEFPAFNLQNKNEAQILFTKAYSPTNQWYGSPIYEGALLDIETYAQISNYHNSNLHNNFSAGYVIMFRGPEPSDEQQDAIVETLREKYGGTENTGKPLIFFLDGEQQAPQIDELDGTDIDKRFEQLIGTIKDNIVISHQIPRQVVGLESAGSLGNSKEILQASQMFRSDYIEPHQHQLLKGFNMVMTINGLEELAITNPNPNVLLFDMTELLNILTRNEVRELLGYEFLEETENNIVQEDNTPTMDEIMNEDLDNQ